MDHALVTVYGPCGTCSPTRPEGRGAVKLAPLRRRRRGERGHVKLCPLRRRSRGERGQERTPPPRGGGVGEMGRGLIRAAVDLNPIPTAIDNVQIASRIQLHRRGAS